MVFAEAARIIRFSKRVPANLIAKEQRVERFGDRVTALSMGRTNQVLERAAVSGDYDLGAVASERYRTVKPILNCAGECLLADSTRQRPGFH